MASGMPVVAGRAVGVVDCVADGDNGVLVEPGDVLGLAQALDALLAAPAERARLARAARADVERLYAWPVVARQIMAAYDAPVRADWADPAVTDEPCRFRAAPHLL
jgi:glycosyltransferase involved in cell wall biosynthesis